jgi:hypothetical protein
MSVPMKGAAVPLLNHAGTKGRGGIAPTHS